MKIEEIQRVVTLARLTVKSPKSVMRAHARGAWSDLESAAVLVENLRRVKNVIKLAKEFLDAGPKKNTVEYILGRSLEWALERRYQEKEAKWDQRIKEYTERYD